MCYLRYGRWLSWRLSSRSARVALPGVDSLAHPARLRVGIVGAGRVGAVLGAALGRAGHEIAAVHAVSHASRERAATLLPGVPVTDLPGAIAGMDLVLLAVPEEELAGLVSGLARAGQWEAGQLVVHTSARHGVEVLAPALAAHALPLALHPPMTFSGTAMDLDRLLDCAFAVTAPEPLRELAMALVLDMGGQPVWIEESARAAYDQALTRGVDRLMTDLAETLGALHAAGIDAPAAVLGPLARATLEDVLRTNRVPTRHADSLLHFPAEEPS